MLLVWLINAFDCQFVVERIIYLSVATALHARSRFIVSICTLMFVKYQADFTCDNDENVFQ